MMGGMGEDWHSLRSTIASEVVRPGDPTYDTVRKPQIANFAAVRPAAIVRCTTADDVVETIKFGHASGLPVVPRSGGHCFAGRSSTTGIVLDVAPMRSVTVEGALASVGAGAVLGDVYDALAAHGLTIPAGCGPTVGIAGLTLGGGLGVLGRTYGLTCDRLRAAQVVLPDGRVVDCDAKHDGDLFWALRGGAGDFFGVVTSLTFETVPAPDTMVFHLVWPHEHAVRLIEAWQAWAPDGPDGLAPSLVIKANGVNVFGTDTGGMTAVLLDELVGRAERAPTQAWYQRMSFRATKQYLAELFPDEDPGDMFSKCEFFRDNLPSGAVAALVEQYGKGDWSRELDFSPWGGAYNRVPAGATAFVHRDARFLLKQAVTVADPARVEDARRWLRESWSLVHPFGTGGAYQNFPDPELDDEPRAYFGANLERFEAIKRMYS